MMMVFTMTMTLAMRMIAVRRRIVIDMRMTVDFPSTKHTTMRIRCLLCVCPLFRYFVVWYGYQRSVMYLLRLSDDDGWRFIL